MYIVKCLEDQPVTDLHAPSCLRQNEGKELSKEEKQRLRKEKKSQKKNKEKKDEQDALASEREKNCAPPTLSQPAAHKGTGRTVAAALPVEMMSMKIHHSL